MGYSEQLQAVIDVVGEQEILDCLSSKIVADKVSVASVLSMGSDGNLTQEDKDIIATL
tara:strand:- start:282 stop:455 length:174 start_codon:yes stop_codon:yes gene_type:complete